MTRSPSELMTVNLLQVFNEPDRARRAAVIAEHYAEDVVWHEPDRIIRGREDFERRAEELRADNPDWVFRPAGAASELDDIGHLGFHYGPADQPPVAIGMDIAWTSDGRIIEVYTIVTEIRRAGLAVVHEDSDNRHGHVEVRRGADRHETRLDWLQGRHSFDTGVDPFGTDTHHGLLVVHNHDIIAANSGFDTHPHRNIEIVTWVLDGTLVHQDSEGHAGVIYPNLVQRMTAGTGIRHSEKNDRPAIAHGVARPVELVQMWVVPDEAQVTPGYEQIELDPHDLQGHLTVVASGMDRDHDTTAIRIRNRFAAFHVTRLDPGQHVEVPDAPYVHAYVARGRVTLEDAGELSSGDAARLTGAGGRRLEAMEPSEVLVWEMHAARRA